VAEDGDGGRGVLVLSRTDCVLLCQRGTEGSARYGSKLEVVPVRTLIENRFWGFEHSEGRLSLHVV